MHESTGFHIIDANIIPFLFVHIIAGDISIPNNVLWLQRNSQFFVIASNLRVLYFCATVNHMVLYFYFENCCTLTYISFLFKQSNHHGLRTKSCIFDGTFTLSFILQYICTCYLCILTLLSKQSYVFNDKSLFLNVRCYHLLCRFEWWNHSSLQ